MKLQDIRDKVNTRLRKATRRLSGSETGEQRRRLDIDRIVRLHCEAEMAKLTASAQRVMATVDSEANSQPVRMLDFGCIAWQEMLGEQSRAHKPLETGNYGRL